MKPIDPNDLPDHNDYGDPTPNEIFLISRINELSQEIGQLSEIIGRLKNKKAIIKDGPKKWNS